MRARLSLLVLFAVACSTPEPMMVGNDAGPNDAGATDTGPRDTGGAPDAFSCPDGDGDGELSIACGGNDCDDADSHRFPGNTEVCDAANVDEDCDAATFGTRDGDGDGHIDATCCNDEGAAPVCGDDCDDTRASVYGGLVESCDGADNDCDTTIDETVLTTYHRDADGDGYASATGETMLACSAPVGFSETATDCDDTNEGVNPATTELCANSIDDNCNGAIDESGPRLFFRDVDGDGYGDPGDSAMMTSCDPPAGYAGNSRDCEDMDTAIHPGAAEVCNGRDDDCSLGLPGGGIDIREDRDFDMHSPITATCVGGYDTDDCRDDDGLTHPGASERCDRIDSDCSSGGGLDAAEDADMDLHAPAGATCSGGYVADDCDDTSASVHPGAAELCDGVDTNCDAGGGASRAEDNDFDGHGSPTASCTPGTLPLDDCDDMNAMIHPGAAELCDHVDTDCNGDNPIVEDADGDFHSAPTAPCTGGFLPKDDCDDTNAAVFPGAAVQTPTLLGPENGALTGGPSALGSLRPTFRWVGSASCSATYEVAVDDSCTMPGFASCAFASPESSMTGVTTTSWRPTTSLPVASVAPVGRRYYWRVRACDGATCSAWAAPRYLDVGRARNDLDGDGYSDVAVGAPGYDSGAGRVLVFRGGASPATTASTTLTDPGAEAGASFGATVAAAGDVNADGYGDLIVGAPGQDMGTSDRGYAFVYLGGASGLVSPPVTTLFGVAEIGARLGAAVAGAGDVDGDGYAEVIVGAPRMDATRTDEGGAFVYYGAAAGTISTAGQALFEPLHQAGAAFGTSVSGVGDVNGDGFSDLAIGAPLRDPVVGVPSDSGSVFFYLGAAVAGPPTPTLRIDVPGAEMESGFGSTLLGADFDGDGYSDLVIAAPSTGAEPDTRGSVWIHRGSRLGIVAAPTIRIDNPLTTVAAMYGLFGAALAAGDVDADGRADLMVGAPAQETPRVQEGNALLFRGRATGLVATPDATIDSALDEQFANFATALSSSDVNGDGYADMVVGVAGHDVAGNPDEGAVYVYEGSAAALPAMPTLTIDGPLHTTSGALGRGVACGDDPRSPEADLPHERSVGLTRRERHRAG